MTVTIPRPMNALDSPHGKQAFHREAKAYLRRLADLAGLPKGGYDIRSCMGGPAISGEAILQGEDVYVTIGDGGTMFRSCKGRKDCLGGANQWWPRERLDDIEAFAAAVRRLGGA